MTPIHVDVAIIGAGTAGMGAKTFNPGNVGNTGSSSKNYGSWQAGMDALGANILILPKSASLQDYYGADMQGE